MAYQALYRKYRPQTFCDVIGQEHITETLKNELASGKIVHAYLFTGTRGTGKTSCAKILAKAVNCTELKNGNPCCECEMCRNISSGEITDIVEIDAASNNGVDSIRELREQINFSPAAAKYRVYIIDEVHMLSIGAFNALLKTLEEPPEHAIFILATTEVHKLPATILSRCQRFDFRRIDSAEICERLQLVAKSEGFSLTEDAATLIASAADGGMRDALSILDLCASNSKTIDEAVVSSVCSMAGNEYLLKMVDFIKACDTQSALLLIDELHNSSVDMLRLLNELIRHYRDLMIIKTVRGKSRPIICSSKKLELLERQAEALDIREIMATLSILQESTATMQNGNRRCEMEMVIIRLCNPQIRQDLSSLEMRVAALESGVNTTPVSNNSLASEPAPTADEQPIDVCFEAPYDEAPTPTAETPLATAACDGEVERWDEILSIVKKTCPIIGGVLQGSNAYINGDLLLIDTDSIQFRSLIKQNPVYKNSIRNAAKEVLGKSYKLGPYNKKSAEPEDDPLSAFAEKLKELESN